MVDVVTAFRFPSLDFVVAEVAEGGEPSLAILL